MRRKTYVETYVEWETTDPDGPEAPPGYAVDYDRTEIVARGRYRAPIVKLSDNARTRVKEDADA